MALLEKTLTEMTVREAAREFELRIPMTYEQFLAELPEDVHAEWVDGETIIFMPPNPNHQRIVSFLLALIKLYIEHFNLGEVLPAPVEMKPTPDGNAREPDILFVALENMDRWGRTKLEGAADLVIEVISPESTKRDTVDKLAEYEAIGVREYWVIDGRKNSQHAFFYVMDQDGQYQSVAPTDGGVFHSAVLDGFWFDVNWLWASPQPTTLEAFAQIVGPDALIARIRNQS